MQGRKVAPLAHLVALILKLRPRLCPQLRKLVFQSLWPLRHVTPAGWIFQPWLQRYVLSLTALPYRWLYTSIMPQIWKQ